MTTLVLPMTTLVLPRSSSACVRSFCSKARVVAKFPILPFNAARAQQLLEKHATLSGVQWRRFPELSRILKGHRRGEMTVLTGPTGSGKTTFLSEYSLDLALSGVRTLWGSFEINNDRLTVTLLNQLAQVRLERHLHLFQQTAEEFSQLPIYFMDVHDRRTLPITLPNVIDTMSSAVSNFGVSHILIDNLQFMMGSSMRNMNRFEYQDSIIQAFREFATKHDCHVTIVIHPRKENTEELTNNSIAGGAKAIHESDNVMILQVKYSGTSFRYKKYLQVTKNRFDGQLGIIPLTFDHEKCGFGLRSFANHDVKSTMHLTE